MAFFGIPMTANLSKVRELVNGVLKLLEQELMKDDPDHFPTYLHDRTDWVEQYSMTKSMSFGMPYEKFDSNAEWKPNGRFLFVFQVADQDATRFSSLLAMAQDNNLWRDLFGKAAFTVQMIPNKEKDEDLGLATKRESYNYIIQKQGSVQLSMGSANINDLLHFSKKITLHRTNDHGTKAPTMKNSVQGVMTYQTLDGDTICLDVIPRYGGGVTCYFSSVLSEMKSYIEQWTQCPAA